MLSLMKTNKCLTFIVLVLITFLLVITVGCTGAGTGDGDGIYSITAFIRGGPNNYAQVELEKAEENITDADITVNNINVPYVAADEQYFIEAIFDIEPGDTVTLRIQHSGIDASFSGISPQRAVITSPTEDQLISVSAPLAVAWTIDPYPSRVKVKVKSDDTQSGENYEENFTNGETDAIIPANTIKDDSSAKIWCWSFQYMEVDDENFSSSYEGSVRVVQDERVGVLTSP